jgi:hypothetical protein
MSGPELEVHPNKSLKPVPDVLNQLRHQSRCYRLHNWNPPSHRRMSHIVLVLLSKGAADTRKFGCRSLQSLKLPDLIR